MTEGITETLTALIGFTCGLVLIATLYLAAKLVLMVSNDSNKNKYIETETKLMNERIKEQQIKNKIKERELYK